MRRNWLAAVVVAVGVGLGAPPGTAAQEAREVRLVVDVSERRLFVLAEGDTVRSYAVAVGKPEHPTPRGTFGIRRIVWNPRWVPPDAEWARGKRARRPGDPRNPMGRVKLFFKEPDYYLHGTREEESLGRAASHGCIRLRNDDVVDLAKIVMEAGGERREPGWFRRVVNRVTRTQEVRLSDPVPVEIVE